MDNGPWLKIYGAFVSNYQRKLDLYGDVLHHSKPVAEAVKLVEKEESSKGQAVKAHFAKVITRIDDYNQFLKLYAVYVKDDPQEARAKNEAKLVIKNVLELIYGE